MNRSKSLVVALTRLSGVLMVFYGLITATFVGPYYHRYAVVYARPEAHHDAGILFWLAILQILLRVAAGLVIFLRAERIIDSLRTLEPEPGFRSLIVALTKLNGFILLFYAGTSVVLPNPVVINLLHNGSPALLDAGPELFRISLNLLAGFLVITCAEKIIDGFERIGASDPPTPLAR